MKGLRYALQDLDQLPKQLDWLTPGERARYDGFRFDKRQRDWLLGRWTAKQALLDLLRLPQSDIARFEVRSAPSGAPEARLDGEPCGTGLGVGTDLIAVTVEGCGPAREYEYAVSYDPLVLGDAEAERARIEAEEIPE